MLRLLHGNRGDGPRNHTLTQHAARAQPAPRSASISHPADSLTGRWDSDTPPRSGL